MLAITTFDRGSAENFRREFQKVFYDGDYKAMASIYTEDAKLMPQDSEIIEGRQAIEEFWKIACARGNSNQMKRTIQDDEVEAAGDLGYKRTTVTLQIPEQNGGTAEHIIKSITVWRRESDGVWRCAIDISNRNHPLTANQFTYGVSLDDKAKA
jgi:uncharacterized protein (TIGR02246 family)